MFINIAPSIRHHVEGRNASWWQADVSDLNGRFHLLDGVWGKDIAYAHKAFEKIALDWDSYDAPSDEAMEASTQALLDDIAIWGCE